MSFYLETPRLILRAFKEDDAAPFSAYRSDPEVARYQGWEAPYPLEKAQRFVSEMMRSQPGKPGSWFQVALERKAGEGLIGDTAFTLLLNDPRQAEIAYTLAPAYQGQGYATEALTRLLVYLFDELGLHRVQANIDPDNTASARLLARVGLRYEGRFVDSLWWKGRWASEDWYAILKTEWRGNH